MEPILFLVHRIPFPPTKGDKVRSFHLLLFLAARFRVHLGTFVDDPRDMQHVAELSRYCASYNAARLSPRIARIRSLTGYLTGESLTLHYYRDRSMAKWVQATLAEHKITKVVVFSTAMGQYVSSIPGLHVVADFVDVDSQKWKQYGHSRQWPLSAVFQREADRLLAFERAVAKKTSATLFVTPQEAELFKSLAPECASRVFPLCNGVNAAFFSCQLGSWNPFAPDEEAIVFTGVMDYWPNIDAVTWFAKEVLPRIVAARPHARFYIVGSRPTSAVKDLAVNPLVVVTGQVEDVRPYLQHARAVVAPMRISRGIQNKVLEAMSMERPVVVWTAAATALSCVSGRDFEVAGTAAEFALKTVRSMDSKRGAVMGSCARARVLADYDWNSNLTPLLSFLRQPSIGTPEQADAQL
jgi:sugar transferase (PEP-CTERM/EpsH1 system associated)